MIMMFVPLSALREQWCHIY